VLFTLVETEIGIRLQEDLLDRAWRGVERFFSSDTGKKAALVGLGALIGIQIDA
jgi:hypothetical protein